MKTFKKIILSFTAVTLFTTLTFAQNQVTSKDVKKTTSAVTTPQGKFVDANKNGVCDNYEARGTAGKGANFVDKNGDGVCDNRATLGKGKGNGCCGQGLRHRCGQGAEKGKCCGQGRGLGNGPGSGKGPKN